MKATALVFLIVVLFGCAGAPPQPEYYLLRGDGGEASRKLAPSRHFAMGQVRLAPYVDQPGIVMQIGEDEIRTANQHLWAEPMQGALQRLIGVEVSRALGEDVFPVTNADGRRAFDVTIDQMHGTLQGEARLVAYWSVRAGHEPLASYRFSETQPLSADGYPALVSALRQLLVSLSGEIADSLLRQQEGP